MFGWCMKTGFGGVPCGFQVGWAPMNDCFNTFVGLGLLGNLCLALLLVCLSVMR